MAIENNTQEGFAVYKGLQAPLMFKGFKGKFIYIGAGVVMGGFIFSAIIISIFGSIPGVITLVVIWGGGFLFVSQGQKKGLHSKKKTKGVFVVINKYKLRKLD